MPWPPQVGQVFGLVPALAPVPEQVSQVTEVGTRICAVLPAIGFLQRDLHVVAQVGAALAAADARRWRAAHDVAEHVLENVGEAEPKSAPKPCAPPPMPPCSKAAWPKRS